MVINNPTPRKVKAVINNINSIGLVESISFCGYWVEDLPNHFEVPQYSCLSAKYYPKGQYPYESENKSGIGNTWFTTCNGKRIRASKDPEYKNDAYIEIAFSLKEEL